MPINFGTFHLADDGQHEPTAELAKALAVLRTSVPSFAVLGFGEGHELP